MFSLSLSSQFRVIAITSDTLPLRKGIRGKNVNCIFEFSDLTSQSSIESIILKVSQTYLYTTCIYAGVNVIVF